MIKGSFFKVLPVLVCMLMFSNMASARRCWRIWGIRICLIYTDPGPGTVGVIMRSSQPNSTISSDPSSKEMQDYIDKKGASAYKDFVTTFEVADAEEFKKAGGKIVGGKIILPQGLSLELSETGKSKYKVEVPKGSYTQGNTSAQNKGQSGSEENKGVATFVKQAGA